METIASEVITASAASRGACTVVVCAALFLPGCESIGIALHLRTRLDKLPVTSIAVSLSPPGGLSPGGKSHLVIVARTADGQTLTTVGTAGGKVLFDSFSFQAEHLEVNAHNGVVSLSADPRVTDGQIPHLHVVVVGHPEVVDDLDVPVRYDVPFKAQFSGADGTRGGDGMNGLDGSSGTSGSIDLTNPSPGGNGSNGSDGGDGSDGWPGQPGERVRVWMTLRGGAQPLLAVRAAGAKRERYFLIDPQGGSLTLEANGGAGGAGGSGGRGGRGGSGGSGFPSGTSGSDGRNGWDGHPGAPGAAGSFEVIVDPQARAYLDRLHLINRSGAGTPGPAPQVEYQSVPPLW